MAATERLWAILAAALLAGVLCAPAASAEELIASNTGHLRGEATGTQEFRFGAATFDCTQAEGSGEVTELKMASLPWTVKLGSCTLGGVGKATVTLLDETLFWFKPASVLHVDPDFTASALGIKCTVVMPAGQSIGEITWVNKSGKVEEKNAITDIEYEVTESNTESLCGKVGAKGTKGTYTGNDLIELEGGTIEVK